MKLHNPEKYQPVLKKLLKIVIFGIPKFGSGGDFEPYLEVIHASDNYRMIYVDTNVHNTTYNAKV